MGSFYGVDFIFDGISSSRYNIKMSNFSVASLDNVQAGSDINIIQKYVNRRSKPFYFGRIFDIPLEFDVTVASDSPISALNRNVLERWLLGRKGYLPLQIIQDDLSEVIFNVMFSKSENLFVGNIQTGFNLHALCDSPWAWSANKKITRTFADNNIVDYDITVFNDSANTDYTYPIVDFTLNSIGNSIAITNYSDVISGSSGSPVYNIFEFTNLLPNENIVVDNDLQTLKTSTNQFRLSNFNKNWFRLKDGINILNVYGGVGSFTITYASARKVGG